MKIYFQVPASDLLNVSLNQSIKKIVKAVAFNS